MSRAAVAILSTQNMLHNLSVLRQKAPDAAVIALVKANAYGHGLRSMAMRLEKGGVESLGVASIEEAMALRDVGVKIPITLMEGVFEQYELLLASCRNFDVVIHTHEQLSWLNKTNLPLPIKIWVKVDTGMGRLGFGMDQIGEVKEALAHCVSVKKPIGLMSHFACADEVGHEQNSHQIEAITSLARSWDGPKSFLNSAAIYNFPELAHDVIRPGLALYGVSPMQGSRDVGLKPVMTLQTRLIAVRQMKKGAALGYGSRYICPEDMPVGIMAMGYGDGYPRSARDGTPVLVNGKRCNLVGRVSMDMATIDLRACPEAAVGDAVVLWGEGLPIEEVASHTAHIPYDLLCAIQLRVKFHWTMG